MADSLRYLPKTQRPIDPTPAMVTQLLQNILANVQNKVSNKNTAAMETLVKAASERGLNTERLEAISQVDPRFQKEFSGVFDALNSAWGQDTQEQLHNRRILRTSGRVLDEFPEDVSLTDSYRNPDINSTVKDLFTRTLTGNPLSQTDSMLYGQEEALGGYLGDDVKNIARYEGQLELSPVEKEKERVRQEEWDKTFKLSERQEGRLDRTLQDSINRTQALNSYYKAIVDNMEEAVDPHVKSLLEAGRLLSSTLDRAQSDLLQLNTQRDNEIKETGVESKETADLTTKIHRQVALGEQRLTRVIEELEKAGVIPEIELPALPTKTPIEEEVENESQKSLSLERIEKDKEIGETIEKAALDFTQQLGNGAAGGAVGRQFKYNSRSTHQ